MILAGDIGGTNTRFGLFEKKGTNVLPIAEKKYASNSWQDINLIIDHFLRSSGKDSTEIDAGCLSLAGPIEGNQCKLTNLGIILDFANIKNNFRDIPFTFCNDLVALGHGLKTLQPNQLFCLTLEKERGRSIGGQRIEQSLNKAILAPGTGLGESMIINGKYITPTEGAHTDFAPRNEREINLWRFLQHEFGHVSYERILSGPGLTNLYRFLLQEENKTSTLSPLPLPEEITEKGRKDQTSLYFRTLKLFIDILGAEAGNVALRSLALGGIYIGGGIVPKILDLIEINEFLTSFRNKGRFRELLEQIPVYIILEEKAALYGAASYALEYKNINLRK